MFQNKKNDVIVMGRIGVDLYVGEPNQDFTTAEILLKQIGGSAGNIAVGLSVAGCSVGLISKVAPDMLGDFVRDYAHSKGIDTTGITHGSAGSRTTLALCETKAENCGAVLYRNQASDLEISTDDIDKNQIANYKALVVTGTGLSAQPSRDATLRALGYARESGVLSILDLDYRESGWHGDDNTQQCYKTACQDADVIIGNLEEFQVMTGGSTENLMKVSDDWLLPQCVYDYIQNLLNQNKHVILKNGLLGAIVFSPDVKPFFTGVFKISALKPYGAGDAFASHVLSHLIHGDDADLQTRWENAIVRGAASAAMVVSRFGCAYAMPTQDEVTQFIKNTDITQKPTPFNPV